MHMKMLEQAIDGKSMGGHGLSDAQLEIILGVLSPFSEKIEQVDLFGSHATGLYRPNSDIDLVIHGSLDEREINRVFTMLNESALPVKVDLQSYQYVRFSPLKAHIDAVMRPLFTHKQLQGVA